MPFCVYKGNFKLARGAETLAKQELVGWSVIMQFNWLVVSSKSFARGSGTMYTARIVSLHVLIIRARIFILDVSS